MGVRHRTETEEQPMYAAGQMANAFVTQPIPQPRTGYDAGCEASEPVARRQTSIGTAWRTIAAILNSAWLSFVPRLHHSPR